MSEPEIIFSFQTDDHGVVRLSRWPEGLVLWVGGRIVWKSWEHRGRSRDATIKAELRCEVAAWVRPAVHALAFMAWLGIPLDYEAFVRRIGARGVKAIVERKA